MITVYIGGGLANKMFQYATSLEIRRLGYEVAYDTHTFQTEFDHDQVRLDDIFSNVVLNESNTHYYVAGKNNKLARLWKRICPSYVIECAYQFNNKFNQQLRKTCLVEGSWQDERYFISSEKEVRDAFKFSELKDIRNIEIAKEMRNTNSVAIHIRKGDGYGSWNIFSNTCPKSYYQAAVDYIKSKVKEPRYFVFSDSPEVVADYLDIDDYVLINWNPSVGKGNYVDMQLMSLAKYNIIANSTYSWWGAWLNQYPDKIVIAPRYWFNPNCNLANVNHIIPARWIKL